MIGIFERYPSANKEDRGFVPTRFSKEVLCTPGDRPPEPIAAVACAIGLESAISHEMNILLEYPSLSCIFNDLAPVVPFDSQLSAPSVQHISAAPVPQEWVTPGPAPKNGQSGRHSDVMR